MSFWQVFSKCNDRKKISGLNRTQEARSPASAKQTPRQNAGAGKVTGLEWSLPLQHRQVLSSFVHLKQRSSLFGLLCGQNRHLKSRLLLQNTWVPEIYLCKYHVYRWKQQQTVSLLNSFLSRKTKMISGLNRTLYSCSTHNPIGAGTHLGNKRAPAPSTPKHHVAVCLTRWIVRSEVWRSICRVSGFQKWIQRKQNWESTIFWEFSGPEQHPELHTRETFSSSLKKAARRRSCVCRHQLLLSAKWFCKHDSGIRWRWHGKGSPDTVKRIFLNIFCAIYIYTYFISFALYNVIYLTYISNIHFISCIKYIII